MTRMTLSYWRRLRRHKQAHRRELAARQVSLVRHQLQRPHQVVGVRHQRLAALAAAGLQQPLALVDLGPRGP